MFPGCRFLIPPYPYNNPYDNDPDSQSGPAVVTRMTATVDGNPDEWDDMLISFAPSAEGSQDENSHPDCDIKAGYVTQDDEYVYGMMELWNTFPNMEITYQVRIEFEGGALNTHVKYDGENEAWMSEIHREFYVEESDDWQIESIYETNDYFSMGEVLEVKIPKEDIFISERNSIEFYTQQELGEDEWGGDYLFFDIQF